MATRVLTEQDILSELTERIRNTSLRRTAAALEVSPAYLSDVMHRRRFISRKICRALGLKRIVVTTRTVTFERNGI